MALEILKDIDKIDGFQIERKKIEDFVESDKYIMVDDDLGVIAFQLQSAPVKDIGIDGCQIDTMLKVCYVMIEHLNLKVPCQQNENAIIHLERAIECLAQRKKDREQRGVEGTQKA